MSPSSSSPHTFQFAAGRIAEAAQAQADQHAARGRYWDQELAEATARVEATMGVRLIHQAVTGGERPEVVVDHGDPVAYRRMQEAYSKRLAHREEQLRYARYARLYRSQDPSRRYELTLEEVDCFGLADEPVPAPEGA